MSCSKPKHQKPGTTPSPSNQGPYPLCTHHAISKAVVNGCDLGKFTSGRKVDLNQDKAEAALVNEFKDLEARDPTEFDGRWAFFTDTRGIQYKITLEISEVNGPWELELTDENMKKHEYLISYRPQLDLHCVHVRRYSEPNKLLHCVNSWDGKEDYPQVSLGAVKMLYKLTFTCVMQTRKSVRLNRGSVPVSVNQRHNTL